MVPSAPLWRGHEETEITMTKRRNRESCLVLEMPSGRDLLRRITTGLGITNDGESAHAPKLARRSSAVAMKSRKMNVEDGLSSAFAGSLSVTRPTGPNPRALPPPHTIAPTRQHTATVVVLHGFTCNGHDFADELLPPLRSRLSRDEFGSLRFVFLTAPMREVSCYGDPKPEHHAWHDYWTDHGGDEGRPDIEEEIDSGQLDWTRQQVHAIMDAEAALLGGDMGRVALVGQSQGSCTATHCALTHPQQPAGLFCSIGMLYTHTPVPPERNGLQIFTFNGAADDCIACCLSLRSYARLLDAGYQLRMHVQPDVGHQGCTDEEVDLLVEALGCWGLV